jgi:group I intron endonuclease
MGVIYMITSPSGKHYVGQTIQPIDKRWKQHIDSAHRKYKDNCRVLNKAIRKYGNKNFSIIVLEECNNEELDIKEKEYIQQHNTLVPNGMNIKFGGKSGRHNEETKKLISTSLQGRKVSKETREKLSSTKNPDLPMYVLKMNNGYRVCNHPMGPEKRFLCKTQPMEYNLNRAIEYVQKLDSLKEPLVVHKNLSKQVYIQKYNNGYCVKYPDSKPKYFVSKKLSTKELYTLAESYLNEIKSKSCVQRLNGSGGVCETADSLKI